MATHDEGIYYQRLMPNDRSLEQVRQLNNVFAEAFEEPETYLGKAPSDEYIRSMLAKEHIMVCTAIDGDQVVGGLVAYVLDKFEQQRSEVYIYDLAVDARYRRRKIATRLIWFLKQEADKSNAWVVFVQADPVDAPAIRLYESLGVREEVFHYDLNKDRSEQ